MTGYISSLTGGEQIEYDYSDGKFTEGVTPPLEDKEQLMDLAFKAVREIMANPERGDTAVNEELYALIGKLPVYDTDGKVAIDNTPHPALDRVLEQKIREQNPDGLATLSGREFASARVVAFPGIDRPDTNLRQNRLECDEEVCGYSAGDHGGCCTTGVTTQVEPHHIQHRFHRDRGHHLGGSRGNNGSCGRVVASTHNR